MAQTLMQGKLIGARLFPDNRQLEMSLEMSNSSVAPTIKK
jgi:hypothetical protein